MPGLEKYAHSNWRPGRNNVAGFERDRSENKSNQCWDAKDQIRVLEFWTTVPFTIAYEKHKLVL